MRLCLETNAIENDNSLKEKFIEKIGISKK